MILHTDGLDIEFFSRHINDLVLNNQFQVNGSIESKDGVMIEFGALIEDEEIVFDAYYDHAHQLSKLHVDEDYERTFYAHFKKEEFEQSKITTSDEY